MDQQRDRGSGSLLAVGAVVIAALAVVVVARVVVAAAQQAQAQHAADAAALAGVSGGAGAAVNIAAANGAELVGFVMSAGRAGGAVRVTVTVRRGDRTATATAEGDRRARFVTWRHEVCHPAAGGRALRSTECPMATSVRRPPTPRTPTRTPPPM
jgi:hypothetical protein